MYSMFWCLSGSTYSPIMQHFYLLHVLITNKRSLDEREKPAIYIYVIRNNMNVIYIYIYIFFFLFFDKVAHFSLAGFTLSPFSKCTYLI